MSQRLSRIRIIGAAAIAGVAASLLASPAGAVPAPAPSIAAVCANADNVNPFTDLAGASGEALAAINCLFDAGLVTGNTATTFNPSGTLTRQQAAALIARLGDAKKANELTPGSSLTPLPAAGADAFTDDEASTLENDINRLAAVGIIRGTSVNTFAPNALVTRGQLATFIDRLETYLVTGSINGVSPWATTTDFFLDDGGSVHEGALNRTASRGILRGDGAFGSGQALSSSRTQAALVIARVAAANHTDSRIKPLPRAAVNATLPVTPLADVIQQFGTTRQYSVGSLAAGEYRITLVRCANIFESAGRFTFVEDGATGLADAGTVAARISVVNGIDVADAQSVGAVAVAAGGTITFTVIDGATTECLTPVVYTDQGGANTRLNLDDLNAPTEPFGVGGSLQYIPAEAGAASISGTVTHVFPGIAVIAPGGSVFFRNGDTYRLSSGGQCPTITATVFATQLSVGDQLATIVNLDFPLPGSYSPGGANTYCLTDLEPVGPTAVVAEPTAGDPDNGATITWTPEPGADIAAQRVYRALSPGVGACEAIAFSSYTLVASVSPSSSSTNVGTLTPGTRYCFLVTSVSGLDESGVTAAASDDMTTAGTIENPIIIGADLTTDTVTEGVVTIGDTFTLLFNEAMNPATVAASTYAFTDTDGDTIVVNCEADAPAADTEATCALDNGDTNTVLNDTLTITLTEPGTDRNGAGDEIVEYGLTITAVTTLTDLDDAATVNVGGSTDKQIGPALGT